MVNAEEVQDRRVHSGRVIQRQVLHLGEFNTTQIESWQRMLEVKMRPAKVRNLG